MLVGAGKRAEAWVAEVLAGENRVLAGPTAPAKGLFLVKVSTATQRNEPNSELISTGH